MSQSARKIVVVGVIGSALAYFQRNGRRAPGHAEPVQGDNRQEKRSGA